MIDFLIIGMAKVDRSDNPAPTPAADFPSSNAQAESLCHQNLKG
jgi:hypothetical protein